MHFLLSRKLVVSHLVPPTQPLNVFALCKDGQISVALTDTAVAVFDGEMPSFLLS